MIEVINLTKKYGNITAVDSINFTINDGEIVGLLGPNGAGKTTIMNMITGYISCSDGQVIINGYDILTDSINAKKSLGYLPEHPPLYTDMTVKDYLTFVFELKKVSLSQEEHINEILKETGLSDVKGRIIKNLSKGYQQRVGLAQALIGNPDVIILDEPTVGLDPNQIVEFRNLISGLKNKHTIILSSHILTEISTLCEKIIIINKGKVVAEDYTENFLNRTTDSNLIVRLSGNIASVTSAISQIEGVLAVDIRGEIDQTVNDYVVTIEPNDEIRNKFTILLAQKGLSALMIKTEQNTLEDIFAQLTLEHEVKGDEL